MYDVSISKVLQSYCRDKKIKYGLLPNHLFQTQKEHGDWKEPIVKINFSKKQCLPVITWNNKNTLTGPASCKKTTRHHTHLSLCEKLRKTNNLKTRKCFFRFGQILKISRSNISKLQFFWNIGFIQIKAHI